jgi:hypothetical protein
MSIKVTISASKFQFISEGSYLRLGQSEFYLDRCTYNPIKGDKRLEVTRASGKLEVRFYTWHLCTNHPRIKAVA